MIKVEANMNRDMPTIVTPGTCATIDESEATLLVLNDTRDGAGTTVIPIALADLLASPHEIHLHSAPDEHAHPIACGEIK